MGWSANARDGMLGQVRGRISHLSIHTGDPGANGANEVASGSYARVAASGADFTAASGGEFTLDTDKGFVAAAAEAATHFGAWDDTTFLGGGAITGDNAFNAEGDYTLKAGTSFTLT
jgi:hypothetical protein